jgi:hypothetical protein
MSIPSTIQPGDDVETIAAKRMLGKFREFWRLTLVGTEVDRALWYSRLNKQQKRIFDTITAAWADQRAGELMQLAVKALKEPPTTPTPEAAKDGEQG